MFFAGPDEPWIRPRASNRLRQQQDSVEASPTTPSYPKDVDAVFAKALEDATSLVPAGSRASGQTLGGRTRTRSPNRKAERRTGGTPATSSGAAACPFLQE